MNKGLESGSAMVVILLGIFGCGTGSAPKGPDGSAGQRKQHITVFAAASATSAVDEIKQQFQQQTGINVQASYAASSTLAQQILHGAGADLFISADTQWADLLEKNSLVAQRRNLVGNRLVVILPADSPCKLQKPQDLLIEEVKHLALADPEAVPAGEYAKQALVKLGIWEPLKPKIVPGADVRQALTYVATGAADAGIVYATDAAVSSSVKVALEIPSDLTGPIRYPVVLLKQGLGKAPAESFYHYLSSPEASKVFRKYGFVVLADSADSVR